MRLYTECRCGWVGEEKALSDENNSNEEPKTGAEAILIKLCPWH